MESDTAIKEQLARVLADYDNLTKRVERERLENKYFAKLLVISKLLPVFDMFYDAQKHTNDAGIAIALKVLEDTLKDDGVVRILPLEGDKFDHDLHEVIDAIPTEDESMAETIKSVSLCGYRFVDGPVVRHAKVSVYKFEK